MCTCARTIFDTLVFFCFFFVCLFVCLFVFQVLRAVAGGDFDRVQQIWNQFWGSIAAHFKPVLATEVRPCLCLYFNCLTLPVAFWCFFVNTLCAASLLFVFFLVLSLPLPPSLSLSLSLSLFISLVGSRLACRLCCTVMTSSTTPSRRCEIATRTARAVQVEGF